MSKTLDHASIRARVGDGAIDKVTRMFNASLSDACLEMLQNARRAGATAVNVTTEPLPSDKTRVTITDDGKGLRDPSVLLTFGESNWEASVAKAEDPAGMGFLSLARLGCTVRWRALDDKPTSSPGCRLTLEPDHFLGRQTAAIEPDEEAPRPHGTAISFDIDQRQSQARWRIQTAARHYPLPVTVDGEAVEQSRFLDQALYTERWKGVVFGVYHQPYRSYERSDLNFHGLTLGVRLPDVSTIDGKPWSARADIESCPALELVLPARKEAVKTPFLNEMRAAARLAIYRAMVKADPPPRLGWKDWKRAADAGLDLPVPPAELRPWRPEAADVDGWDEPPPYAPVSADNPALKAHPPLVVTAEFDSPEAQAFYRAAQRAQLADRLFEADRRFEGLPWYDQLARLDQVTTRIILGGVSHSLEQIAASRVGSDPVRPEAIHIECHISSPASDLYALSPNETFTLAADVALVGDLGAWFQDVLPLVVPNAEVAPQNLATLLVDAFFSPSDDAEADAYSTQRERYAAEAMHEATRILVNGDEAYKGLIADTVRRELHWICPDDRAVDIHILGTTIRISLGPAPAPPANC